jgi:RNA polymerase primary sigma factor
LTEAPKHTSSPDKPVGDDQNGSMIDIIPSETPDTDVDLIEDSLREDIHRVLQKLNERERDVIRLFFGIEQKQAWTLEEIGDKFDLTRERARQLKEKR